MVCPKCKYENADNTNFCIKCGSQLNKIENVTEMKEDDKSSNSSIANENIIINDLGKKDVINDNNSELINNNIIGDINKIDNNANKVSNNFNNGMNNNFNNGNNGMNSNFNNGNNGMNSNFNNGNNGMNNNFNNGNIGMNNNYNNGNAGMNNNFNNGNIGMNNNFNNGMNNPELSLNYFSYGISIIKKPFETFKNEINKLSVKKNSIMLALIVSILMTLLNLFTIMVNTVVTKEYSLKTFKYETVLKFSNLKNLEYFSLIGKDFIYFAGSIVVLAAGYYIVCDLYKKNTNFYKNLSIAATSAIPKLVCGLLLGPILGKIWEPLDGIITVLGNIYCFLIIVSFMNTQINFKSNDEKITIHLICLYIVALFKKVLMLTMYK